jgi:hypothetical protein
MAYYVNMDIQVGNGNIDIVDKAIKLIGNRILSMSVITTQGACTDEMCPLIKKIVCNITDNFEMNSSYKIQSPVKIEMPQEVYYSIDKERQHIKIKISLNGKLEIKGLSLIGTV